MLHFGSDSRFNNSRKFDITLGILINCDLLVQIGAGKDDSLLRQRDEHNNKSVTSHLYTRTSLLVKASVGSFGQCSKSSPFHPQAREEL